MNCQRAVYTLMGDRTSNLFPAHIPHDYTLCGIMNQLWSLEPGTRARVGFFLEVASDLDRGVE